MADLSTFLTEVEAAISALISGGAIQSYTLTTPGGGTRTVSRENLAELRAWRKELRTEIAEARAAASPGGTVNYGRRGAP